MSYLQLGVFSNLHLDVHKHPNKEIRNLDSCMSYLQLGVFSNLHLDVHKHPNKEIRHLDSCMSYLQLGIFSNLHLDVHKHPNKEIGNRDSCDVIPFNLGSLAICTLMSAVFDGFLPRLAAGPSVGWAAYCR